MDIEYMQTPRWWDPCHASRKKAFCSFSNNFHYWWFCSILLVESPKNSWVIVLWTYSDCSHSCADNDQCESCVQYTCLDTLFACTALSKNRVCIKAEQGFERSANNSSIFHNLSDIFENVFLRDTSHYRRKLGVVACRRSWMCVYCSIYCVSTFDDDLVSKEIES